MALFLTEDGQPESGGSTVLSRDRFGPRRVLRMADLTMWPGSGRSDLSLFINGELAETRHGI